MSKATKNFIEVLIDGKHHIINIDNIAIIKQVDRYTMQVFLLTKDENQEQIHFKWNWNIGDVRYQLKFLEKFMYPEPFVTKE